MGMTGAKVGEAEKHGVMEGRRVASARQLTLTTGLVLAFLWPGMSVAEDARWASLSASVPDLYRQGQFAAATSVARETLTCAERVFGLEHPATAQSQNNLASLHSLMGDDNAALANFVRSFAIACRAGDPDLTQSIQRNLALNFRRQDRMELAIFFGKASVNAIQSMRANIRSFDRVSVLPAVAGELGAIVRTKGNPSGAFSGEIFLNSGFTAERYRRVIEAGLPVIHPATHFKFSPALEAQNFLLLGDGQPLILVGRMSPGLRFRNLQLLTLLAGKTALGGASENGRAVESLGARAQLRGAPGERRFPRDSAGPFAPPCYQAPFVLMGNWL